tara:strand:+ start:3758 stop:4381 length:624 start_codon:yes stop_codon:yes gene_type:complete
MTLQASGTISMDNIRTEFGDTGSIALSECYRGGSIVPSSLSDTATAGSLAFSSSHSGRGGVDSGPNWNGSSLLSYGLWSDNGAASVQTWSFTVNKTGTYHYYYGYYYGGFGNTNTATIVLAKNGTNVLNQGLSSNDSTNSHTGSCAVTAGDTISGSFSGRSAGWSANSFYIGGNSYSTRTVTVTTNASVPTSGVIDLQDFYSATNSI